MLEKGICVYSFNTIGERFVTFGVQMYKVKKKPPNKCFFTRQQVIAHFMVSWVCITVISKTCETNNNNFEGFIKGIVESERIRVSTTVKISLN